MDHITQTITELQKKIVEKEAELNGMKTAVNQLCVLNKQGPVYNVTDTQQENEPAKLKGDEYYMQPLATVVSRILEDRRVKGLGPAVVKEIYQQMVEGGYKFDAKNDDNAMRGIRISMGKNVVTFHKLPSGKFGLTKWYPELRDKKQANSKAQEESKATEEPKE